MLVALVALVAFGSIRYDGFLTEFNVLSVVRYNSMFALVSLGMCLVIMAGGIDLSVGGVAALASVVSAFASAGGLVAGLTAGTATGIAAGIANGFFVTQMRLPPFIATLATMLAAYGLALYLADNQSVSVSYDSLFVELGQGSLFSRYQPEIDPVTYSLLSPFYNFPTPGWIAVAAFLCGGLVMNFLPFGRRLLAIGGNENSSRMMGLPVQFTVWMTYAVSGGLAGLAGVILAAQFGAGQPTEGSGWELFAIAAVVVGGTHLTGGKGSLGATLSGVLLLGVIFTILNFENGMGWISLSAYWQSVIRGVFLLIVVLLQASLIRDDGKELVKS